MLSCIALPRTVLLILGGAVGDRWGPRRVMITGDSVMLVVSLVVATVAWRAGTPLALLIGAALITGAVDAFYLPSAGSMPRRLVAEPDLPRALAMRQAGSQAITVAGGPFGGALVATAGFAVASWVDAGTFAVVLIVLVTIRSRFPLPAQRRALSGATSPTASGSPPRLSTAPHTHLARVQSLLSIAQSAALLIMNTVLGLIAHATTARLTLLTCAGVLLAATVVAYCSPGIRAINKNP